MPDLDTTAPQALLNYRPRISDMTVLRPDGATEPPMSLESQIERVGSPAITEPGKLEKRSGFDPDFLPGFKVDLPRPTGRAALDILPVGGDASGRLNYMHFSVVMSKSRRMALFTAVNIDGKRSVSIPREGGDKWFLDGRIPIESQLGEELYAGNGLDRGHLVRREDPNWEADGTGEALIANNDTFHFTNCAPQMNVVNQRTWLGLENYILRNGRAWKERVSVFTGPIFGVNDVAYRGARIPAAFWKVVAFLSDDGRPSATAYVVQQDEELRLLEAAYGAYKTYQRSVRHVEALTGLSFNRLRDYDGFSNEEVESGILVLAELKDLRDIRV